MVLLVAADGRELAGVRRRCRRLERLKWPVRFAWRGELCGRVVVMVADGPGGALAAGAVRTACERESMDAVVSAGWCGALETGLAPGEVFVASQVEAEDGTACYEGGMLRARTPFRTGRLVTVDRVVGTAREKARLRAKGAAAVDMEAVAVAAEASRLARKFFCVRVVLDGAEENFGLDFNTARRENGPFSRLKIVCAALARPWKGVPELVRWGRRSRYAARALGDFMAECAFDH